MCTDEIEDLPWGQSCDPGAELPTAPPLDDGGNSTDIDEDDSDWEDDAAMVDVDTTEVDGNDTVDEVEVVTEDTGKVDGRLSNECPVNYDFGSCSGYEPGLRCGYNHIYTGCTWDALGCTAVMTCTCGGLVGGGDWACMSFAMMPCENKPEGLPTFQGCDPNAPLPTEDGATSSTMESRTRPSDSLPLLGGALP